MISYDWRIKPLRDTSRVRLLPHTVALRVPGSSRDGKINRQEALTVASLVAAAIEEPEYKKNGAGQPLSFGVVSLVGDEQAIEIDNLLRAHLSPDRYELHRLLCGNAAQFQGDERDVIFISLVDTAQRGALSLRDQELFKQRFNVAASRARDQMWVIHSLSPHNDLKAEDLRRQLIEHAQDPSRLMRALEEKEKRTQSPFEREVMKPVLEKLQLREISPAVAKAESPRKGTLSPGLIDRLVSHAEELRAAWSAPQEPSATRQREPTHVLRNEYSAN